MRSTLKTMLNYYDWSELVKSMTKTRQDNDVTDRIVVVYVENDTKLRDRWDRVLTMMKTR